MFAISTLRREGHAVSERQSDPELFSRTVGLFETEAEAVRVFDKNLGDLNEAGYYPLAVIERIEWGLYNPEKLDKLKGGGSQLRASENEGGDERIESLSWEQKVLWLCTINSDILSTILI